MDLTVSDRYHYWTRRPQTILVRRPDSGCHGTPQGCQRGAFTPVLDGLSQVCDIVSPHPPSRFGGWAKAHFGGPSSVPSSLRVHFWSSDMADASGSPAMEAIEEILEWAEGHAEGVTQEMAWKATDYSSGGYWKAVDPSAMSRIRARVTAALDFLERFAGPESRWTESAHNVFNNHGERQSMESGAHAVGSVLTEWIRAVRSGQVKPRLVESFSVRAASSSDLLEQVRALNSNSDVVPAAPIMLAGAALEIALRSAVAELGIALDGRPSIDAYARALRNADVLNRQDLKEVVQMAGLRNNAAHGEHDLLSRERAGLMEQQVNLFLSRLDQAVQHSI